MWWNDADMKNMKAFGFYISLIIISIMYCSCTYTHRGFKKKLLKVQYYAHWGWYFYFSQKCLHSIMYKIHIIVFLQAAAPFLFILCLKAPFIILRLLPKSPVFLLWLFNSHRSEQTTPTMFPHQLCQCFCNLGDAGCVVEGSDSVIITSQTSS